MPRKKSRKRSKPKRRGKTSFARRHPWWSLLLFGCIVFLAYLLYLNWQITSRFEGRRWDLPARVYARPLELYAGLSLSAAEMEQELRRLGYRQTQTEPDKAGYYRRYGRNAQSIEAVTREFRFWDERQPPTRVRVTFDRGKIDSVAVPGEQSPVVRLDPLLVGSIFPRHGEDRLIVTPEQVPEALRQALIVVEDRRYLQHIGVDPIALGRALLANVRAGEVAQGGSTLTQQLVKNYFLDNRRTVGRKLREALMSLILELHYSKPDILNAYINEIYLGQDGQRAIHGFGLASQFYFSRPLDELELHQIALLVALVRGPGYYDPLRSPARARERRNLVLRLMQEAAVVTADVAQRAQQQPLDTWDRKTAGASYYPAYLELVREQLAEQYDPADLTRQGLRIFSALDPLAQASAERHLAEGLATLDARQPDKKLAGAAVIASPQSGDVLALVGDRRAGYEGFNRALAASRPVGSLIKPAVYLAALESRRYTLASRIEDAAIEVPLENGDTWAPHNFSNEAIGEVTLLRALAESLNLATVRLGMDVGVAAVADLLGRLGFDRTVTPYPSLLLGAVEMTPMQVTQIYSTLANGGFRTPLRAVRSIVNAEGEPLQRYPIVVAQVVDSGSAFQLNQGLVAVMQQGTGRSADPGMTVAGKTGTSDEFRDSWFAGFSGDRVAAVWVGYDDYQPTSLSGASGALPIWSAIMRDVAIVPYSQSVPAGLEHTWVDYYSGARVARNCETAVELALPGYAELSRHGGCSSGPRGIGERTLKWLNDVFN